MSRECVNIYSICLKEIHAWGKMRILNDNTHVPRSLYSEE